MHFTTLFLLKGAKLEDLSKNEIEDMFCDRFCYCCGETKPMYDYWCDWFQIGGRWCDMLKATKGITCDRGYPNEGEPIVKGKYSIVEIKDLEEEINKEYIYAIATKSRIYQNKVGKDKFTQLLNDINNKKINGVIALIDCHD